MSPLETRDRVITYPCIVIGWLRGAARSLHHYLNLENGWPTPAAIRSNLPVCFVHLQWGWLRFCNWAVEWGPWRHVNFLYLLNNILEKHVKYVCSCRATLTNFYIDQREQEKKKITFLACRKVSFIHISNSSATLAICMLKR